MMWMLAVLPPLAAALALARLAPSRGERVALAPVAIGLAFGAASVIWSGLFFAGVRPRGLLLALDAGAWIAITIVVAAMRRGQGAPAAPARPAASRWLTIGAAMILLATAAVAVSSFVASSTVSPHGEWDAWAQWNLRARFFFRGFEGGTWRNAFAPVLAWSHADYPPLVPASVARLWLYVARDTTAAPIGLAALVAVSAIAAAGFGVARTRGAARGCVAAAAMLACPSFVRYAAAQCADIPLALYILAAFILWSHADGSPRPRVWLALAGLSAALAAWTKNEGIAFLIVFLALVTAERLRRTGWSGLRDVAIVVVGAAPVMLLVVMFKETLAPPSYFVAEQSIRQAVAGVFDPARARFVGEAFARELWLGGATRIGVVPFLCLFLAARGVDRQSPAGARAAMPAVAAMLMIYAIAYLVSPKDLAWQVKTSLDRVVVQLVPTLAWSFMTVAK